jgi:hypothetical protein
MEEPILDEAIKRPNGKSAKASQEQSVKGLNEIKIAIGGGFWLFDYDVHHYLRKHGDAFCD